MNSRKFTFINLRSYASSTPISSYFPPEYRAELRRLMYLSIDGPEDDE
jgi:hypothetical protein